MVSVICATKSGVNLVHRLRNLLQSGYCMWFNMPTSPTLLRHQRSSLAPGHRPKSGATQRVTRPATPIPPIPQPASELIPASQFQGRKTCETGMAPASHPRFAATNPTHSTSRTSTSTDVAWVENVVPGGLPGFVVGACRASRPALRWTIVSARPGFDQLAGYVVSCTVVTLGDSLASMTPMTSMTP